MTETKKIAIIGGGISGLVSLKECLSANLDAEILESRPEIGGQWAYQPVSPDLDSKDHDIQSSVYDGVILNSCRDTSGFSDFPIDPARHGDFFNHRLMLRYIQEYAAHFDLLQRIQYGVRVIECTQNKDGRWTVRLQNKEKQEEERIYDAVIAATGQDSEPFTPAIADRELFPGEFMHSHLYRQPGRFDGKRVVLIGIGAAAVDIACELAAGAKEVHIVSTRGTWVCPRYVLGKPLEAWDSRASYVMVPSSVANYMETKLLELVQGKHPESLQADHKFQSQNPTIRSEFVERVRQGAVKVHRGRVERFDGEGVVLDSGERIAADTVIACTGYKHERSYLPTDALRKEDTPDNQFDLYKMLVPSRYSNLFVVGMVAVLGPLPPTAEAQARFTAAVLTGKITLPGPEKLKQEISAWHKWHADAFLGGASHGTLVQYLPYVDQLMAPLGATPTFGKLLGYMFGANGGNPIKGFSLMNAVYFGIITPAQWRVFGEGAKNALAVETVLRTAGGKGALSKKERGLIGLKMD